MVYENLFYRNIRGEWVVRTFTANDTSQAAAKTKICIAELRLTTYYLWVSLLDTWMYEPPFATNPTYWSTEDVPAEVRALNLIHQP